jgi:3-oxoacyl-[acyl-carrier protein] reductase
MEKVVQEIRATNPETAKLRISVHQVDVGIVSDMDKLFEEVKVQHEGKLVDILVSNAGYGKRIVDVW